MIVPLSADFDAASFTTSITELRDSFIADGISSISKYETSDFKRVAALAGMEMCRNLESIADFEAVITARNAEEMRMRHENIEDIDTYWSFRIATAQIEFIYERMKVVANARGMSGTHSVRAIIDVAAKMGERAARP